MKLWRIYQDANNEYDTYDSAVVAAETEEEARDIHPGSIREGVEYIVPWKDNDEYVFHSWAKERSQVGVILIGEATPDTKPGVICSSFNAG